jgi:long-chain acyl-CoA synthetase
VSLTIPAYLFDNATRRRDKPAYWVREATGWKPTTWGGYADEVRTVGRAMMALGLGAGSKACILGFNRPEWAITCLAIQSIGGAAAGIYTTNSPEEVVHIVHHSEARLIVVENHAQWEKVKEMRGSLPLLHWVVLMKGAEPIDDPMVLTWERFLSKAEERSVAEFDAARHAIEPGGLASLIYTSGTTGPPKGVMLSHRNLAWTARCACDLVNGRPTDWSLSYLPLSHIAEQMLSLYLPIVAGASLYFAQSIEKVPDNLKEVQPTVFFGVPRIWEKFHAGITGRLREAKGPKKHLVEWAMKVAREVNRLKGDGAKVPDLVLLQYRLADRLVYSKLKKAIGLSNVRVCSSGAAPIPKEILEFMSSLDVVIFEVYGQSEDCGPTTFNRFGKYRFGTVGPAIAGADVVIAPDGEIMVAGPNVFMGYYKEPQATAEALEGEYLHTGDLGEFDADGFLKITGRKKEILITSGGKNISPKNIESALKSHAPVGEAVIVGDRRNYLTALITLEPEAAAATLKAAGAPENAPHDHPALQQRVAAIVAEVNKHFARVEQVKKFTILPRAFTIDAGELTPTLKVKRRVIYDRYASEIEKMYEGGAASD